MTKGRHASASTGSFYRDLVMMVLGIALVGAAVFLLLYLFAGDPGADAAGSTSTTLESGRTTVADSSTSTSEAAPTTDSTPATTTTTTIPVRPPSEVRVVVLNSIGLAGAAGRMTQRLADAGYQTQEADDYEPEQDPSRIWYREGFAPEANAMLDFLPAALVEAIPDTSLEEGADVIVVLGTGYEE